MHGTEVLNCKIVCIHCSWKFI